MSTIGRRRVPFPSPEVPVTVDDLIDEGLDYLRAHPNAKKERVREYLIDFAHGRVGRERESLSNRMFWYGPMFVLLTEALEAVFGSPTTRKVDEALRVVFPPKWKKERRE